MEKTALVDGVASAADQCLFLSFLILVLFKCDGPREMDPFSIETYFYLGLIPLFVGRVLQEFGVDQPTIDLVEAVVFLVAALANFLIW